MREGYFYPSRTLPKKAVWIIAISDAVNDAPQMGKETDIRFLSCPGRIADEKHFKKIPIGFRKGDGEPAVDAKAGSP